MAKSQFKVERSLLPVVWPMCGLCAPFEGCFRQNILCASLVLLDFSLYVKAATLIFISGCGLANSSAKEGKSGFIYNLVKS